MSKKVSIFYDKSREEKKDSHAKITAKCAFCNFYFWGLRRSKGRSFLIGVIEK